jgi:fermentation-respiration switch protein FrsA (DUF1100 family)
MPAVDSSAASEPRAFPFAFFTASGVLAATVFRDVHDLATPRPTVVVTGSWLTVKEQMPDRYAAELAKRGFTAVTFDFTGFGASTGDPRQAEVPSRKIADIAAVAGALDTLSFVAPGGVGHLAVCASAQYTLQAMRAGAPITAFAAVAGWFHDATSVAPLYGGADGVGLRLDRARQALSTFQRSGEMRMVPAYAEGDDRAGMFLPLDYYASAKRGAVPEWRNEMAELSWLHWLTFDGVVGAEEVGTPSLFVHSDDCVLPDNVRRLAAAMPAAELAWGSGTQVDFYDQPEQVDFAIAAAAAHFDRHLPAGSRAR